MNCEYETTCGIVFDGSLYNHIKDALITRCNKRSQPIAESVDVYRDPNDTTGRYREITRFSTPFAANDVCTERRWDHKKTVYVQESQIPYFEQTDGRVLFTTCTYKASNERSMTCAEWENTVKEDHASGRYTRVGNKMRICFYVGAFETSARYTRVSIGEQSTYSGTLEARSTCNSIYYMEIEHETREQLDWFAMQHAMHELNNFLFELIPYKLVRRSMSASNSCSVQRERVDNIFDTFKRNFQNYTARKADLRHTTTQNLNSARLDFYVMPKWDGVRAVGLYYCEGYLLVKDAYGRLASFNVNLPFDNDMVFQLEVVDQKPQENRQEQNEKMCDSEGRYYVITELMAVLIKSQSTMYQVYGRNTVAHDTCRNIGNIVDGVSIKTQFDDSTHVCNLYRLLPADMSLRVLSALTTRKEINTNNGGNGCGGIVTLTAVINIKSTENVNILNLMDVCSITVKNKRDAKLRRRLLTEFSKVFPAFIQNDQRFHNNCEGLILAYTVHRNVRPCKKVKGAVRVKKTKNPFDYGYFKLKHVNTVDLELDLNDGSLRSANGTAYAAKGLPTIQDNENNNNKHVRGWAERPVPVKNRRVIVECYFNGKRLRFLRDRYDKSRPDCDSKIAATDKTLYSVCRLTEKL